MRTVNPTLVLALALAAPLAAASEPVSPDDWRNSGTPEEKLERVVASMPSTSRIMIEIGERYRTLYWAGKLGQWEFAQYQTEEMQKLVELLQTTRPNRAASAQDFLDKAFAGYPEAIARQDWELFQKAFHAMRGECLICHGKNEHPFITLPEHPASASSPVLNLPSAGKP